MTSHTSTLILTNLATAALAVGLLVWGLGRKEDANGASSSTLELQVDASISGSQGNLQTTGGTNIQGIKSRNPSLKDDSGRDLDSYSDLGEAITAALAISDPLKQLQAVSQLLANLDAENVATVLEAFENGPKNSSGEFLYKQFLGEWAKIDGQAALDYYMSSEGARKTRSGDDTIMLAYAKTDPEGAKAYLPNIKDKDTRISLHHRVVEALASVDLADATRFSEENTLSRWRGYSISLLTDRYLEQGGIEALSDWVDGIDTEAGNQRDSYKRYAIEQAADRLSDNNDPAVVEWVEERLETGLVNDEALADAARVAGNGSPADGIDWLMGLEASDSLRYEAVAETVESWARKDPEAAGEWLSQQELGPNMDRTVEEFAGEIIRADPLAAMEWGQVISNDSRRQRMLLYIGREWIQRDRDGASVWLTENLDVIPEGVARDLARRLN